jgi:hypothetical protein
MDILKRSLIIHQMKLPVEFNYGKQSESADDYRDDCLRLTPSERLTCIQKLRVAFWGDAAATGRLQRSVVSLKRARG